MESDNWKSILAMLDMGTDPFRNGTDCCCALHTSANRYKRALNRIRYNASEEELPDLLNELESSCKTILYEGCRMFEICGRVYVLEMCI